MSKKRTGRPRNDRNIRRSLTIGKLWLRDGGICHLCGKAVPDPKNEDRSKPLGPLSATRDHVVPLGDGGVNDKSNIKLAHYSCNHLAGKHKDTGNARI